MLAMMRNALLIIVTSIKACRLIRLKFKNVSREKRDDDRDDRDCANR